MVVKDGVQVAGEMKGVAFAGQVVAAVDTSRVREWSVQLLSGASAGQDISLPRQCLEPYTGEVPLCLQHVHTSYRWYYQHNSCSTCISPASHRNPLTK